MTRNGKYGLTSKHLPRIRDHMVVSSLKEKIIFGAFDREIIVSSMKLTIRFK